MLCISINFDWNDILHDTFISYVCTTRSGLLRFSINECTNAYMYVSKIR